MTETIGTAGQEAAKLLAVVQDWARTKLDGEHLASGASECQVCPICQGVAALRHVRPETVEHLMDAAASFVAALKSTVAGSPPPPPSSGKVQHIDVREG